MTQREAIQEVHDRVRQCFTRHRFETFGDALDWWHKIEYEDQQLEAGEQGMSKFSTDILWLISQFGPKEPIDYNVMAVRKVPALRKVAVKEDIDEVEMPAPTSRTRRSRRRRF